MQSQSQVNLTCCLQILWNSTITSRSQTCYNIPSSLWPIPPLGLSYVPLELTVTLGLVRVSATVTVHIQAMDRRDGPGGPETVVDNEIA